MSMQLIDLVHGDKIYLTAGGTGGHMFPAQALAYALVSQGRQVTVLTDQRGASYLQLPKQVTIKILNLSNLSRGGVLGKGLGIGQMLLRFFDIWRNMRLDQPQCVVGFGGYPAVPTLLSALVRRVPISLHEQNGVMGRVNRWFVRWAQSVGVSFPGTQKIPLRFQDKIILTGLPVRDQVQQAAAIPYQLPKDDEPLRILILGGSQGAGVFSEILPQAMALLDPVQQQRLSIVQQCRKQQLKETKKVYKTVLAKVKLRDFIKDIGPELAKAHLVITRAGASTTAELLAVGRPAIFVPYPHATDDHQTVNARYAESLGLGWVIPQASFTPEILARHLTDLIQQPQQLLRAAGGRAANVKS